MDDAGFSDLIDSVKWMRLHQKGKAKGGRVSVVSPVDVRAIRRKAGLSQADFARLLKVSKGTLLNWEQGRRKPTGPASALLTAVANDPKHVIRALHA